jgi:hypothetical protein
MADKNKQEEEEEVSIVDLFDYGSIKSAVGNDSETEEKAEEAAETEETASEKSEETETAENANDDSSEKESKESEEIENTSEQINESGGNEEDDGFKDLIQHLVDEGTVEVDEDTEVDMSVEGLKQLVSSTAEKAKATGIEEYKKSYGEEAGKLFDILEKGGTVKDFVNIDSQVDYSTVETHTKDGEPNTKILEYLIEDLLIEQKLSKEEISEKIADYKDAGLLEKEGRSAKTQLAKIQQQKNENRIKELEIAKKAEEERNVKLADEFKEKVTGLKEIKGFSVTKKQSEELYDFITKPVGPNGETEFQMKNNEETQLLFALLAMNGFDKTKLSKEISTKQAIKIKKSINNYTDKQSKQKASPASQQSVKTTSPKIHWNMGS